VKINKLDTRQRIQELFQSINIEDGSRLVGLTLCSVSFKESVMEIHFEVTGGMITSTDLHQIAEPIIEATGMFYNLWRVASIPQTDRPKLMAVLMQFTTEEEPPG